MPLQNRGTPFGEIVSVPERGMFMGNRGRLHDEERRVCAVRRWIICRTEFKDRKRTLMAPGQYTELFFLDEATALAAGHRPCAECRREDYRRFKTAWLMGNADAGLAENCSVDEIDRWLHQERLADVGNAGFGETGLHLARKRVYSERCGDLPDGAFVTLPGAAEAFLVWQRELYRWTPGGLWRARAAGS